MPTREEEIYEEYDFIRSIQSFLAVICGGFICYSFFRFSDLRSPGFTIVFYMTLCDVLANLSFLVFPGNPPSGNECIAQSVISQMFQIASAFWALLIALTLYSVVMALHPKSWLCKFVNSPPRYHCFVWSLSIMSAILPLTTGNTGRSGPWCWIKMSPRPWGAFWMITSFFGIIWLIILINVVLYLRIRAKIFVILHSSHRALSPAGTSRPRARVTNTPASDKLVEFHRQLIWYPVILIIAWLIPTIVRVMQLVRGDEDIADLPKGRTIMIVFQLSSGMFVTGVLNSIAYGLTPAVREKWYDMWCDLWFSKDISVLFDMEGTVTEVFRDSVSIIVREELEDLRSSASVAFNPTQLHLQKSTLPELLKSDSSRSIGRFSASSSRSFRTPQPRAPSQPRPYSSSQPRPPGASLSFIKHQSSSSSLASSSVISPPSFAPHEISSHTDNPTPSYPNPTPLSHLTQSQFPQATRQHSQSVGTMIDYFQTRRFDHQSLTNKASSSSSFSILPTPIPPSSSSSSSSPSQGRQHSSSLGSMDYNTPRPNFNDLIQTDYQTDQSIYQKGASIVQYYPQPSSHLKTVQKSTQIDKNSRNESSYVTTNSSLNGTVLSNDSSRITSVRTNDGSVDFSLSSVFSDDARISGRNPRMNSNIISNITKTKI